MHHLSLVTALVAAYSSVALCASSDRAEAIRFFQSVLGKKIGMHTTGKLAGDKIEYEFSRTVVYSNLMQAQEGFSVDFVSSIQQKNWDLDSHGHHIGQPRVEDRILAIRWTFGEKRSTGKLVGVATSLAHSQPAPLGSSYSMRLAAANGRVEIDSVTNGYEDYFAPGGKYEPGADLCHYTLAIESGKFVRRVRCQSYNVNPDTFERTTVRDPADTYTDVEMP